MSGRGRVHDRAILDALEAIDPGPFEGNVWRVTRKGRNPVRGTSAHGRWSPSGEFEVLYTSLEREGALAEIGYRLSLEPVWPSRMEHEIHLMEVRTERTLRLPNIEALSSLAVDTARYQSFDYSATQTIAAAAQFLEFDALVVPNARFACSNLVIFTDRVIPSGRLEVVETVDVDWALWRRMSRHG